ncbi:YgaP family membrane protein [Leptospira idonii]|uniref:DUF2892 domain-containing protein n=1 Tax=Leptospira idonii TaxID=1193500 RepID=A0A4R9M4Y1_9LEPT|nr:DUF2892 domain-containing protein [Leptospira idonii]TGN20299.1 DUF2892 domain-containing protein [Leptospira idonii]
MYTNMGIYDRIIRGTVAVVIGGLYFTGLIEGSVAIIVALVGLLLVSTAAIGFCPFYLPFDLTTKTKG